MKKILLLILVFTIKGYAQDTLKKKFSPNYQTGIVAGYFNQTTNFMTVGRLLGVNYGTKLNVPTFGTGLCMDIGYNSTTMTLGPRLFEEIHFKFIGARIGLAEYFQNNSHELLGSAEIYVTIFGLFNISYGFSNPLFYSRNLTGLSNQKFGIQYNFIRRK